jgi:tetratricopeptide (TPR) repeat protein
MDISFEYIELLWALLLLPIIAIIYFYALYKKKKVAKQLGDPILVDQLTAHYSKTSYPKKFLLLFLAMGLILLTLANLRTKTGSEKITKNGIDVMIAIDVSKSMLAKDIQPTRLDRAKQVLSKLIDKLNNDRIGIVVFAGKAYLQMPLTADHAAAKMYLSAATPETVPTQGTVIGDALKMCYAAFNTKEKKYKSIVLISDGEDHDENAMEVATELAQQGVVVHTIGIGSPDGANIIDEQTGEPKKDNQGNVVITKLNEQALADIAAKGKGSYQLYNNADVVVANVQKQLAAMDTRNVEDDSLANFKSWFQILLGIALLFLVIEFFISEVKKRNMSSLKYITTLFLFFVNTNIFAQAENEFIQKGNEAYKNSEFTKAITQYEIATQKNANNTTAQFNLGNAFYKANKKEEAINAFDKTAKDAVKPQDKSNSLYNKAVILQNDKKLQECVDAYKKALIQDPSNEDARHNLQIALQQQKENQQKDKKDKDKDKNKQDNKDKKDEKEPKPQPSNISKKDAEQKLNALQQKEKELQDKLHKVNAASPNRPEKDW